MAQIVTAYGKTLRFPDEMSLEEIESSIRKFEHQINPDYQESNRSIIDSAISSINNFIDSEPSLGGTAKPENGERVRLQGGRNRLKPVNDTQPANEVDSGFTGLLRSPMRGAKQTGRNINAMANTLAEDYESVEDIAAASGRATSEMPVEQKHLLQEVHNINRDQGVLGQVGDTLSAASDNKLGTAQLIAEQAPNTVVSLGAGYAGAKGGALLGAKVGAFTAAPPVIAATTAIGGVIGFLGGMFLGNYMLEGGARAIEKAEGGLTPEERDAVITESAKKAAVMTGVDAATLKIGSVITNRLGGRIAVQAGAKAETEVLMKAGVDMTSPKTINAALIANPQLMKAAKIAGEKAAISTLSKSKRAGIAATGVTTETLGEGIGEYAGEVAATGEGDAVDATLEALAGFSQSAVETAYNANRIGNKLNLDNIKQVADSINQENLKQGLTNIENAQSVDEAINAAQETVSQDTITSDDVLAEADPTLADIERLTGLKPTEVIEQAEAVEQTIAKEQERIQVYAGKPRITLKNKVATPTGENVNPEIGITQAVLPDTSEIVPAGKPIFRLKETQQTPTVDITKTDPQESSQVDFKVENLPENNNSFEQTSDQDVPEPVSVSPKLDESVTEQSSLGVEQEEIATKLEDFGEKIGGAKKDLIASNSKQWTDDDYNNLPLSKLWPKSDIESIENKTLSALATAARSQIPIKPRTKHNIARWSEKVKTLRGLITIVASHDDPKARIAELRKKTPTLDKFFDKVEVLDSLERRDWDRIGKIDVYPDAYRNIKDGGIELKPFASVYIDGDRRTIEGVKTVAQAIPEIRKILNSKKTTNTRKKLAFEVRGKVGNYYIMKKGDKEYRKLKTFPSVKEAMLYKSDNYEDLVTAWEKIKERDNVNKRDTRGEINRLRNSKDYREGKDITPEEFTERFGFRGVEFGNWVAQGKGSSDRQGMLNRIYDALMDLSEIIGAPPKALSLNGTLGLAIGARGYGSASAHFEPSKIVINLTKTKGAGTLAHEWFHALDNYFQNQRGENNIPGMKRFITYQPEPLWVNTKYKMAPISRSRLDYLLKLNGTENRLWEEKDWIKDPDHPKGVRPVVEESMANLVNVLNSAPMAKRARRTDSGKSKPYWSQIIEIAARSFENYVIADMADKGYHNDFLANVIPVDLFARDAERYPYHTPEEMNEVREAFKKLFNTIKTKKTDKGIAFFSKSDSDTSEGISEESAKKSIKNIIGDKAGQLLLESGVISLIEDIESFSRHPDIKALDVDKDTRGVALSDGRIILVLSNLDEKSINGVFLHESFHAGVKSLIGQETYSNLMSSLEEQLPLAKGSDWIKKAQAAVPTDTRQEYVTEEIAAYAIEQYVNGDKQPNFIKRWVESFLSAIRAAIIKAKFISEKIKFRVMKDIKPQDLANLAVSALKAKTKTASHSKQELKFSKADDGIAFADEVLTELAGVDELFRFPISKKLTLDGVFEDVFPNVEYLGENTRIDERDESGADRRFVFRSAQGNIFYVYERDNGEVFIDVSRFKTGERGQGVYAAVGNYAYNTRKVFIADPAGLTPDSLIRRTSNMLSLALRFGTTKHIDASLQQIKGDIENGVEPLDWRGDDVAKTRALIHTFITTLHNQFPQLKGYHYDFDKREFRDRRGRPVGVDRFADIRRLGVARAARAGEATARRGVLIQSLVSSESSERPGILEQVISRAGSLVKEGDLTALFSKSSKEALSVNNDTVTRESTDQEDTLQPEHAETDSLPKETLVRKTQRIFQDKFNRFTVIKEWLAEHGTVLSDQADVHLAEERYHSKFANQVEDFRNNIRNPLIKKIADAGYTMSDIADFLEAQHAAEANVAIQKLHNDPTATAYGVTDKEAKDYLDKADKKLANLANEFRNITEITKKLRLDNGILNTDITDAWEKAYKHYIPVKGGVDDKPSKTSSGKGLKVNVKNKRRLGHGRRDESVIENILLDHERAIMEVEKNRVGKHIVMMAAEAGRDDLITIDKPEKRKILRSKTTYGVTVNGMLSQVFQTKEAALSYKNKLPSTLKNVKLGDIAIENINDDRIMYSAMPQLAENEINVYMDGHAIRVQINDDLMAQAYGNLGIDGVGWILSGGRVLNNFLSKVYTGYNPEFILTNIIRDFSTGVINASGEEGILMAMKTIANYPAVFKSLFMYAAFDKSDKWIDMYRKSGGNTGAAYLSDLERLGEEVATEYASYRGVINNLEVGDMTNATRAAGKKLFNATLKWIESINQAGENAMRLSAFKAMIESDKTVNQAAHVAKNITVNFNRKGERGAEMNAAYLFFNASVQGLAASTHALFKGKHKYQAQALTASMAYIGYMAAMAFGGGDEEEYDELNDYTKERNIVIKNKEGWTKIPIPYGYGFAWNFGRIMADTQRHDELGKSPWRLTANAIQELTPFGDIVGGSEEGFESETVAFGVLPTAAKIAAQPIFNRSSFSGTPLMPDNFFDGSQPDRERMWRGTKGTVYDNTAGWLQDVMGVDVSPETLKHITRSFTGGAGALVDTTISSAMLKKEGVELDAQEKPFIRKLYTEITISDKRNNYYKAAEEAKRTAEQFNRIKNQNDFSKQISFARQNRELLYLNKYANALRKYIKEIRDKQDAIRGSDQLSEKEKRLKLKASESEESKLYDKYLDVFKVKKLQLKERSST